MPELVVRLRVAGDKDVKQALDSLGAQAQDVGIKILGTGQSSRQLAQEARQARQAMGDFSTTLSGVSGIVRILAKDNPELQATIDRVTGTIALGTTALSIYRGAARLATSELVALRLAALSAWAAIALPVAAIAGLVLFAKVMADLSHDTDRTSQSFIDLNVQLAQAEARFQNLGEAAQDAAAHMRGVVPPQGIESGLRVLREIDRLRDRPPRKAEIDEFTEERKATDAARRAESAEREAERRAEEAARERKRELDEQRRQAAQLITLRGEALRAMFELQGRSFDAQLAHLIAAYQRERAEHAGQKEALLAIDARFWAESRLMAKRAQEDIAQQARSVIAQIRDVDMAILGIRKEFFGISAEEQTAALEAMKATLDPTKDADQITQINRELLSIYKDQSESLQQQAGALREKAAAEGVTISQQTAMLAKARELEETAARMRRELPAKAKELGAEIIASLSAQRQALQSQFDQLRQDFAYVGTASAALTKTLGNQWTAVAQHIVTAMRSAMAQVAAMMGKPMPAVPAPIPGFAPPGGGVGSTGVQFPAAAPATSPALVTPVTDKRGGFILIDAPGFGRTPGAVTSAVAMEQLVAQGATDLVKVLNQWITEGGGKGITVQINGMTINLDADEERIFRKLLEHIAATGRRTPTAL